MEQKIIYVQDDGMVVVITPSSNILQFRTIQEIAEKDVPEGKPYKIVSADDIPSDRTFRNAWTIDETILTDGIGADRSTFE